MSFIVPGPPPDATQTRRGLVSTVGQTFGGLKRFLHGLRTSKVVFDDLSEQTTAANELAEGVGVTITIEDGVATISAAAGKPIQQGAGGILVSDDGAKVTIALSTTVTADVFNSRSEGWLTVGSNASRVRLGGTDILTHVLGDLVAEKGGIRSGPIDSLMRQLNRGANTRNYLTSYASAWNAPPSDSNRAHYVLDLATRWVTIEGSFGFPTTAVAHGVARAICTLPTEIQPPSGIYSGVARMGLGTATVACLLEIEGSTLSVRPLSGAWAYTSSTATVGSITYPLA